MYLPHNWKENLISSGIYFFKTELWTQRDSKYETASMISNLYRKHPYSTCWSRYTLIVIVFDRMTKSQVYKCRHLFSSYVWGAAGVRWSRLVHLDKSASHIFLLGPGATLDVFLPWRWQNITLMGTPSRLPNSVGQSRSYDLTQIKR